MLLRTGIDQVAGRRASPGTREAGRRASPRPPADRLEASRLLADRGWGKAAVFADQEGDPLDLEDVEAAAEEFRRMVLRLVEHEPESSNPT
jgi:hypothetical protein